MQWGRPEWLYALWALIPLAWLGRALLRRRQRRLQQLVDAQVWPVLAPERAPQRERMRLVLWLVAAALLLVALARPQWGLQVEEVRRRGLDLIVVLDVSNSMRAEDLKPNRLQQAKWGIRDLVNRLHGDRVGLVLFAGSSFLSCPLTIDYAAFRMTSDDAYAGIIPRGGTAIEQALRNALSSFDSEETGSDRAIVLITDGEDHEGNPLNLVAELKRQNIRVFAVGVGTLEGELIPNPTPDGGAFLKDRDGQIVKSVLHEDTLRRLALETGGAYVRAAPGDFGLERIYDQGLAHLQRNERESRLTRTYADRFYWMVGAATALLMVETLIGARRHTAREART